MLLPHSLDVLVEFLLGDLHWRGQERHDILVLETMCPVRGTVTVFVAQVQIAVLGLEHLNEVGVAFACGDVQTGEAALVLDLEVATAVHELFHDVLHVLLGRQVHGRVPTDVHVVCQVNLRVVPQKDVDDRYVLPLDRVLLTRRKEQRLAKRSHESKRPERNSTFLAGPSLCECLHEGVSGR